jgi:hypothetical protein
LGSLFEPHHEQNLSANPKRTAKSFAIIQTKPDKLCSNNFLKNFTWQKPLFFKANRMKTRLKDLIINSTQRKITKNLCLRTGLDDLRQRSLAIWKE